MHRDENVRRLDVAVNDALLMRMLNRVANLHEQIQPLARVQLVLVAIIRDPNAAHQFHDEVRPAGIGRAGVEDARDIRMVHQRQRLAFGFEAGNDLLWCPCPA